MRGTPYSLPMATLEEYLENHNVLQAEFAARLGINQSMVSRLANMSAMPSLRLAAKIERETGGEVTALSWVEEGAKRQAKPKRARKRRRVVPPQPDSR